ncbi:hypothetical protein O3M35_002147 [Rhynocoris fuscipes]|uniref:Elongation of very long chain fatty acids protein n=1 Tax=Rhynocoris fuscipes TaxID=488301 RepID=A0AAW1CXJ8_9HEMI
MSIIYKTQEFYNHLMYESADPVSKDYFLMGSPFPILFILISYHYFVLKLGPYLMRNREPFNLKKIILVYNIIQVCCCSYIFYMGTKELYGWTGKYKWFCQPPETGGGDFSELVARCTYLYFMLKIADLLDTIFFVLRKQFHKASFLHLYHHTGMVLMVWCGLKWVPGGHTTFLGYMNSFVHMIMYSYYTLALLDSKRFVWIKKYVTQLQMAQFFINVIHSLSLVVTPNCEYPKWTVMVVTPQNIFMLFLFWDFYRKQYLKPKQEKDGKSI